MKKHINIEGGKGCMVVGLVTPLALFALSLWYSKAPSIISIGLATPFCLLFLLTLSPTEEVIYDRKKRQLVETTTVLWYITLKKRKVLAYGKDIGEVVSVRINFKWNKSDRNAEKIYYVTRFIHADDWADSCSKEIFRSTNESAASKPARREARRLGIGIDNRIQEDNYSDIMFS